MPKFAIERDPDVLRSKLGAKPPKTSLVLGIDLGTTCGFSYAYHPIGQPVDPNKIDIHIGQLDLSAGSFDSGAIRFVRLRQFLSVLKPDLVATEDVKYTPGEKPNRVNIHAIISRAATSMELFGGFKATVAAWCEENQVPCTSFPIGTLKRRATSKGNANKSDMIRACNALFGTEMDADDYVSAGYDNAADSAFVCLLALETYGRGVIPVDDIAGDV